MLDDAVKLKDKPYDWKGTIGSGKKYELTDEIRSFRGVILHRIKALKDFGDVKKGELGGWIESEKNLSHDGTCWIYNDACVCDDAFVGDNARVANSAKIFGEARVYGCAWAYEHAKVYNNALIFDKARVHGGATICGNAQICDEAEVRGISCITDGAKIYGHSCIYGCSQIYGWAKVCNANIYGDARIDSNALINNTGDYAVITGFGSGFRSTTFFKCEDGDINVCCGCFHGSIADFKKQVRKTHGHNKYAKEYLYIIKLIKRHFKK